VFRSLQRAGTPLWTATVEQLAERVIVLKRCVELAISRAHPIAHKAVADPPVNDLLRGHITHT